MADKKYDIVIIGSGIGGLICGNVLAKEGLSVCVLEKNKQIGGSLQTFSRDKTVFDSGVHYIGGLDKGQNLYQVFKYLGVMDKLKLCHCCGTFRACLRRIISQCERLLRQAFDESPGLRFAALKW